MGAKSSKEQSTTKHQRSEVEILYLSQYACSQSHRTAGSRYQPSVQESGTVNSPETFETNEKVNSCVSKWIQIEKC